MGHINEQLQLDAVARVLESAVPPAHVAQRRSKPDRGSGAAGQAPNIAGIFIAQMYNSASPGRSDTGSFDHGVIWCSRLFNAQV